MWKVTYTYWFSSFMGGETREEWHLYNVTNADDLETAIKGKVSELQRNYTHVGFNIEKV